MTKSKSQLANAEPRPGAPGLCQLALIILVSVVIARATMLEGLRDPFGVSPNSQPYPRGAGPAAGLVLDLLCCVPALLLLPRPSLSCVLYLLLGLWTAASVLWADDQFAAAVCAAHVIAAVAVLWAAARIVTDWRRFRLVAAIAQGLLLLYLSQCILYRFVELPATLHEFQLHKDEFLKERGWEPNSFLARQFEKKLENGEMLGFNGSSNSLAATLVLLLGVSAGPLLQRIADQQWDGSLTIGLAIPLTFWILYYTQCKAAFVTPLLIAAMLLLRRRINYFTGLAIILAALAAVLGYGLIYHGLPSASLNFRWRYWTAAWQMFLARPWLGVGWSNFGLHYPRYRLPVAAEEIQEPHNFFIRWLTELGIIGALLGVAWLARMWWELSRPTAQSSVPATQSSRTGLGLIALIAALGMSLNVLAAVDLDESGSFVLMELLKRMLFFCMLVLGASMAAIRSLKEARLDERPAPWVLYATLASLGAFLVHNLIEFSLYETGPMMLFALLAGSALGLRRGPAKPGRLAAVGLIPAVAVWIAAALGLVLPVVQAEALAQQGDDDLRASHLDEAADLYQQAYRDHVPYNSDYLYRAASALAHEPRDNRAAVKALLDEAIAENPSSVVYYLSRAGVQTNVDAVKADFEKALELNPNEVSIYLDFADALARFGQLADAAEQDELALKYNDLLPTEEPKRLNDAAIRERWADVLTTMGKTGEAAEQARQALKDNEALSADDPQRLTTKEIDRIRKMAYAAPTGL
jgi:tetratricopeptide (TPR) repeat protein/predicted membrane protein